jgi:hypothetical protein
VVNAIIRGWQARRTLNEAFSATLSSEGRR